MALAISLFNRLVAMTLFSRDEDGQGMVEYGLILALIAVVCVVAFTALGAKIGTTIGDVTSAL